MPENPLKVSPSLTDMLVSASCNQGHGVQSGNFQLLNEPGHKVMPECKSGCFPPALSNKAHVMSAV